MNIIKSPHNAVGNAHNPFQGKAKKVLAVCSAGLLRSPTMANVLHRELGVNTRACGSNRNFALVPLSEALVAWCDEIVFVDRECYNDLWQEDKELLLDYSPKIVVLNIPDNYTYMSLDAQEECLTQYMNAEWS